MTNTSEVEVFCAEAPMATLYRVSRSQRSFDLFGCSLNALPGLAMFVYPAILVARDVAELIEFLRHGLTAWISAAPIMLIVAPFLSWYGLVHARIVRKFWLDAFGRATAFTEGDVTEVSSIPYAYFNGFRHVSGVVNSLSLAGETFTGVPESVLGQIHLGDRLRVEHTLRTSYVVSIERPVGLGRLERPMVQGGASG